VTPTRAALAAGSWFAAVGGGSPAPGDAEAAAGAGIGANAAVWSALIRSVISPVVRWFHSAVFAAAGLAGTVAKFGNGSLLPGGGGRCSAILPPTALFHHASGPDEGLSEQPPTITVHARAKTGMRLICLGPAGMTVA
jgi:hypothetical protein